MFQDFFDTNDRDRKHLPWQVHILLIFLPGAILEKGRKWRLSIIFAIPCLLLLYISPELVTTDYSTGTSLMVSQDTLYLHRCYVDMVRKIKIGALMAGQRMF